MKLPVLQVLGLANGMVSIGGIYLRLGCYSKIFLSSWLLAP